MVGLAVRQSQSKNGIRQSVFDVETQSPTGTLVDKYAVVPVAEAPNEAEEFIDQSGLTRQGRND